MKQYLDNIKGKYKKDKKREKWSSYNNLGKNVRTPERVG
jgi:hypothetical protein